MMENQRRILRLNGHTMELGKRTLVMGILNATPDSFSDGGSFNSLDKAVEHAKKMVEEGADIIDVGGESTRPGSQTVTLDEELRRVIPVIEALSAQLDIPISIDTYKAEVARQALQAGAHIINDVWGFKEDPAMAGTAAEFDCPVILMHNRRNMDYSNFMEDVKSDLQESVNLALDAGVRSEQIVLDPGIGFAKTYELNLELMRRLHELLELGYPLLLGTSRKSFIRQTLGLPADDVVEGTAATAVLGIASGCGIVRVHDVKAVRRAADMTDAIVGRG